MTTKLKRLWHRASMRVPNESGKRWIKERTFSDCSEDPNSPGGSFDKVTMLKKALTDAGPHGLICSLTNRFTRHTLQLCWHQTSGRLLEDDHAQRHISPQELCAFASVAVDPTLGNCSARVYTVKQDVNEEKSHPNNTFNSVELPRPSALSRSHDSLTTIGEASIQEDASTHSGSTAAAAAAGGGIGGLSHYNTLPEGGLGHRRVRPSLDGGKHSMHEGGAVKLRESRFELYLLIHWALVSGDRPCYTAEWAISPAGASVQDWQVWQTFADQLLLDCCPQGTTAMRRTPPALFGQRSNHVLVAYMTPDDVSPVMIMDVKEQQIGSMGSMATRSMATRQSVFDMPHLEYGNILPVVNVVIENQMDDVTLVQGSTVALRCSCPSSDTWQTSIEPQQHVTATYSPQEDTRAAAAIMLFSMDKPCGPWLRDRPTIAILWRIRNDVVHAYMMAAECGRWDALVLDTHLEISLPTANKASARHSGLRSDARQTSQRIPLDETAKSQVSLELSWQADEGIRLKVVISHHNNLPSRSSTVGSDHEPPRSPDVLSRTSSVRYRHNGRVLTRLNGTIIRTAVPRELAAPVLFTIKINNQHQRLNLFNGRIVTLVGTLMSTAIEQLVGGQDGTCLLSPGIHSGDITGFMIFSICSASNNMPLDRHPCLIIAWRVTAHGLPQILVHTMHILPNQAAMLVESEMAERFFTGLENQLIESETLQRLIKLNTQDSLSLAVYMRKGKEGEVTGLEVLATAEPIPPAALASMMVNNANQSSGPELECGKMETKSITPPSSSNNNNSSNSSSSNSEADKETSVEESSTEKESTNDSVQMESSTSTSSCGVQPVVITPDASPTQTFEDNAQDGMDRSTLTGTTTPNNITATSTAVPTPVMTPTSGPEIANDPCPALSLPMATTLTEGSVTETQLTLMVANIGTQARLQFFAAYPLDVVGSGLSNPIIESGEQAIIILQETLDPSLSSSQPMDTVIAAPLSRHASTNQPKALDGCMVFMLELPEDQTPSSPVYLLVAWRVAMEAGDENCMQVALIQDAKQSLPIDDEEWEEFLLKLGQSVYQPNQSEKLYYNVEGIPMGMLAKMTHGATATLSIRLKSGDGVLAGNPDITLQAPGTLDQWDMATSPLPMDSNMIYGNMSDNAGPFSPLLSSIHNSYSATTFLTVTINNRHNSLILRPSAVCMVAGSCASPLIDDLFPQASNKLEIMSAMRPVTCSGLIMMQLCTEDGLVVAGEPYMVIGWDIDQEMEERHFFARICDNPYKSSNDDYDTDDHTRNNGNSGSGHEATAANIIGSGDLDGIKTDQKTLEENWMARTALLQKMMHGRAHEAGRRVTTRCIIAGNTLPGDSQLAVTAFMSSVGAPRLEVDFGRDA